MLGAAEGARPGRRPRAARRAARPRQDDARRASSPSRWARGMQPTSGPALERAGDLAAILTNLDDGDVLFIDEVHRLPRAVEEVLYPAMEDFQLDIVDRQGSDRAHDPPRPAPLHARRRDHAHRPDHRPAARPLRLRRPPRLLRARRAHHDPAARRVDPRRRRSTPRARRRSRREPRGTPRIAQPAAEARARLRRGARRRHASTPTPPGPRSALFEVDELGLDKVDRAILAALCRTFAGRPVGLCARSRVAVGEAPETVEDVYEPFLLQCGLLERTPRGRVATPAAFAHLGLATRLPRPDGRARLPNLFDRTKPERSRPMSDAPVRPTWCAPRSSTASRDVTIDNGKANALSPDVIAALGAALDRAEDAGEDGSARARDHRRARDALRRLRPRGDAIGPARPAGSSPTAARSITRCFGVGRCRWSSRAPVTRSRPARCCCSAPTTASARRGEFRIGLIETQIGMVLPRWAVELREERLSPAALPARDRRAPRSTTPTGAADAGFLDVAVDPDRVLDDALARGRAARGRCPRSAYAGQVKHEPRGASRPARRRRGRRSRAAASTS